MELIFNDNSIMLKPWVQDILRNICEGFILELKKVKENQEKLSGLKRKIIVNPSEIEKNQVLIFVNEKKVPIKDWVRLVIQKTLLGFISALDGIPEDWKELMQIKFKVVY